MIVGRWGDADSHGMCFRMAMSGDGGGNVCLRFQGEMGKLCLGQNQGDAGGVCGTLWQRFVL